MDTELIRDLSRTLPGLLLGFAAVWNVLLLLATVAFPPLRRYSLASWILFMLGWGGLYILFDAVEPTQWQPLWLFFFLLMIGLAGFALPVVVFLNLRFPSDPPVPAGVLLREALWFGGYFPALAWLQLGRVLNPLIAILLLVGILLVEGLLRMREKSQWKPEA